MAISPKKILKVLNPPEHHWVGDGFKVHNFIPSVLPMEYSSPFVMMDYGATTYFKPTDTPRGVGSHPHRGFETVTIAYKGKVAHHDSRGNSGVIGEGEVQWMTAGSGILHKEYHEKEFAKKGGDFQMVQLWVNLPAKYKMTSPNYQAISKDDIAIVELENGSGCAKIIAGEFMGVKGPAKTFSPISMVNLYLEANSSTSFDIPNSFNGFVLAIEGRALINGQEVNLNQLAVLGQDGESVTIESNEGGTFLLLSGEPINEPVFSYGPFLMNTKEQIIEAIQDFNSGKFGELD